MVALLPNPRERAEFSRRLSRKNGKGRVAAFKEQVCRFVAAMRGARHFPPRSISDVVVNAQRDAQAIETRAQDSKCLPEREPLLLVSLVNSA